MNTIAVFDLNKEKKMIYEALIHAVRTNSGLGFHKDNQGGPAYMAHVDGITAVNAGDSPGDNVLYKMLRSLTEELGDSAYIPISTWADFCQLASDGYQQARELEKRLTHS